MTKRPGDKTVVLNQEAEKGSTLPPVSPLPIQPWQQYAPEDDTIDLVELVRTLWRYKWLILLLTALAIGGSFGVVRFLPQQYQARITFLQISGNGGSSQMGQLGGLASIAGISLPDKSANALTDKIEVVLKSRGFAEKIVGDLNLLPVIYKDFYNPQTGVYDLPEQPSTLDGAGAVMGAIEYGSTVEGAQEIEVAWDEPAIAAELANYSLKALESYLAENTLTASQKNLQFIEKQLEKAERELRQGEESLRTFNREKQYFIHTAESQVMAETLAEIQAMRAKSEVEREVMLQFRHEQSPQVQQLQLGNQALERQIGKYTNKLQKQSDVVGTLSFEKEFLTKELEVYQEIYKQLRIQLEQGKLNASKDRAMFRVIDPALEPESPSKPKKRLIVALSGVVALFFGIFLAFFIEFVRNLSAEKD